MTGKRGKGRGGVDRDGTVSVADSDSILPLFTDLASLKGTVAQDAAVKLISTLEHELRQSTEKTAGYSSAQSLDDVLRSYPSNFGYSLKRLIKGLPSSVDNTRIGFSTVLVKLLSIMPDISLAHCNALLVDVIPMAGSAKRSEERDRCLGRLFGSAAFLKAQLIARTTTRSSDVQFLVSELLSLAQKKTWLRTSCWSEILQLTKFQESSPPWESDFIKWLAAEVMKGSEEGWFPANLAIVIQLQIKGYEIDWSPLLKRGFRQPFALHKENLPILAKMLQDLPTKGKDGFLVSPGSNFRPEPSICWQVLLSPYEKNADAHDKRYVRFDLLWKAVVDEQFFAPSAPDTRKLWGLNLLARCINLATRYDDPAFMITANFVKVWETHLSSKDRVLHVAAKKVAEALSDEAKNGLGLAVLRKLVKTCGHHRFDQVTGTKTIEKILTNMSDQDVARYIGDLVKAFQSASKTLSNDQALLWQERESIMNQFLMVVRNGGIKKTHQSVSDIIHILSECAFFTKAHSSDQLLAREHEVARQRLLSILAELIWKPVLEREDDPSEGQGPVYWSLKVLNIVRNHRLNGEVQPLTAVNDELKESMQSSFQKVEKLKQMIAQDDKRRRTLQSFQIMYTNIALAAYADQDIDLMEARQDLDMCIAHYLGEQTPKPGGPEYVDVLVDLILSLLSKPSVFLRATAEYAFAGIVSEVKQSTIRLLLDVIASSVNEDEQMTKDEDVDVDETDEKLVDARNGFNALDNNHHLSDDEMSDELSTKSSEHDSEDSQSDGSTSSSSQSAEEDDMPLDPSFRLQVGKALQIDEKALLEEDDNGEDEQGDDDLMTDEQMLEIDTALSALFKERTSSRKTAKIAAEDMSQFKHKILDLLAVFAKRQPESGLLCLLFVPLIKIVRADPSSSLANNIKSFLLEKLIKSKTHPQDSTKSIAAMKELHTLVSKSTRPEVVTLCGLSCTFLVRSALREEHRTAELQEDDPDVKSIVRLYRESWTTYATKKTTALTTKFFQDYANRYPALAADLLSSCLRNLLPHRHDKSARPKQGLKIIHAILQNADVLSRLCPATILKATPEMSKLAIAIFQSASTPAEKAESQSWGPADLKGYMKELILMMRSTKKIIPDVNAWASAWNLPRLLAVYQDLIESSRFSKLPAYKGHYSTMIKIAGTMPNGKAGTGTQKGQPADTDED